jgi:hypothetical protein
VDVEVGGEGDGGEGYCYVCGTDGPTSEIDIERQGRVIYGWQLRQLGIEDEVLKKAYL